MLLETLVSVHKTVGFAVQQDRNFYSPFCEPTIWSWLFF